MEVKLSFFFWNGLFDFNLQGKMLAGIVESFFFFEKHVKLTDS